jgi:tRNA(adenine34) deaminase
VWSSDDRRWMQRALELAQTAEAAGEVPVGAVLIYKGESIGEGYNYPIKSCDPSSHAEINALREAGRVLKNYRLTDSTLYVTLEPCAMCVTALIHARISRLVFATPDPKTGAVISAISLLNANYHNHRIQVEQGLLAEEASLLLKTFFQKRRNI